MDYLTTHRSLSPIRRGVVPSFVIYNLENKYAHALDNYEQSCFVRSDFFKMKCVCKTQMMPASSTTKTGCHDIAEILLKVALNTINQIKSNQSFKM